MHIPEAARQEWAEWIINLSTVGYNRSAVKIQIPLQKAAGFFYSYLIKKAKGHRMLLN